MHIMSLSLENFRNYKKEYIEFSPGTNIVIGDNAQGKTNILEAVYMFSCGRSHRAKQDAELIRFAEESARMELEFFTADREFKAQMLLLRDGKKSVKINSIPIGKLSKLMSYLKVVLFCPEDLSLVKGSPSIRRRFMDTSISGLYPNYFQSLVSYQKALSQKNAVLKALKKSGKKYDSSLSAWNSCIAAEGEKIIEYRQKFVYELCEYSKQIQSEISAEELNLEYEPSIKSNFFEYLESHQAREIEIASSLFGIQRDDIKITVGGHDTRMFCSQGQQRTAALSLKIALADYVQAVSGEYPVLLLDDIMSELDKSRRQYLWRKIENKQVLITCTEADEYIKSDNIKILHVMEGTVEEG